MNDPLDNGTPAFVQGERRRTGLLLALATGGFFLLVAAWYSWPGAFARTIEDTPVTWAMASALADLVLIVAALAWFAQRHSRAQRLGREEWRKAG